MIVKMRPLLERFPEDGQTIGEMLRKVEDFRIIRQEHHHIVNELRNADPKAART
jgi:hypothetical protein